MKQTMSNVIAFYASGTDSTASVLTSTFYMLMKHQDIQEKLREELRKKTEEHGPLSYAKLKEMKLLTSVIKETLRMYPPYPVLYPRVAQKTDKLCGFTIPNKTHIIIDAVGHNRHPKYWSNPDVFDPSRFDNNPRAPKYVLAWGSGPQEKVSRALAMVTMRSTIATLLIRYQIIPDPAFHSATSHATSRRHEAKGTEEVDLPGVHFERSVMSLRPKPALIGRVSAIPASV